MSDIGQQLADAYQAAGQDGEPPLEQILDALQAGETEIERLYAINAELLAEMERIYTQSGTHEIRDHLRAAIAKARVGHHA